MSNVKKFKNGKIVLRFDKDFTNIDEYYDGDMFWNDLYLIQIHGYQYLVDFNTRRLYELGSYLMQNPLKYIEEEIKEHGKLVFYPLSKKECVSLLEDLENGY